MQATSQIISTLPEGLVLEVQIEDLNFKAYVVVSEPDIHQMTRFVSPEAYAQANDWHVAAIASADEAESQVTDIAFNMNLDDAAVFLCVNPKAYHAALQALGQAGTDQ